ncbi:hypothetical protein QO002_005863 [Pararhizobium capsulatum DSM 1112]|uniref:Uncharacterized protein n=1 Tax=Pararhizobium capsulatum DSM 1112 TaxID=1121113 RepID=A0ABU0BZG9_9HYPH|nr:hypothetical protein [Pararhizobium capsulatum]MDQ0323656.1 hypothetical protein [Pararhizobium capsulatum DSM 1112]
MKKMISALGAAAIAAIVGLTSVFPASAAPIAPTRVQVTSDVDLVEHRHSDNGKSEWKRRHNNRHDHAERRHDRRHYRAEGRHNRWDDRAEWRHERRGYWHGHRGYREYRRGYRRHNDGYYYSLDVFQLFL